MGRPPVLHESVPGPHVHVGVEDRSKVLPILKALLTRTAHLQCLSASSPFWAGADTGYADNRAMMFQQLPTAGAPEQFSTWEQLESYTGDLVHTGVIEDFTEIRWDVRPSPRLGTIEVRACDAATNLTELAGMAALTQCLVESFSRTLDRGEELDSLPDWYVAENKWRSARYGMDAILIVNSAGEEELVGDTVERMLTELAPVAAALGPPAPAAAPRAWDGAMPPICPTYPGIRRFTHCNMRHSRTQMLATPRAFVNSPRGILRVFVRPLRNVSFHHNFP